MLVSPFLCFNTILGMIPDVSNTLSISFLSSPIVVERYLGRTSSPKILKRQNIDLDHSTFSTNTEEESLSAIPIDLDFLFGKKTGKSFENYLEYLDKFHRIKKRFGEEIKPEEVLGLYLTNELSDIHPYAADSDYLFISVLDYFDVSMRKQILSAVLPHKSAQIIPESTSAAATIADRYFKTNSFSILNLRGSEPVLTQFEVSRSDTEKPELKVKERKVFPDGAVVCDKDIRILLSRNIEKNIKTYNEELFVFSHKNVIENQDEDFIKRPFVFKQPVLEELLRGMSSNRKIVEMMNVNIYSKLEDHPKCHKVGAIGIIEFDISEILKYTQRNVEEVIVLPETPIEILCSEESPLFVISDFFGNTANKDIHFISHQDIFMGNLKLMNFVVTDDDIVRSSDLPASSYPPLIEKVNLVKMVGEYVKDKRYLTFEYLRYKEIKAIDDLEKLAEKVSNVEGDTADMAENLYEGLYEASKNFLKYFNHCSMKDKSLKTTFVLHKSSLEEFKKTLVTLKKNSKFTELAREMTQFYKENKDNPETTRAFDQKSIAMRIQLIKEEKHLKKMADARQKVFHILKNDLALNDPFGGSIEMDEDREFEINEKLVSIWNDGNIADITTFYTVLAERFSLENNEDISSEDKFTKVIEIYRNKKSITDSIKTDDVVETKALENTDENHNETNNTENIEKDVNNNVL